jgi:hypothetical protein
MDLPKSVLLMSLAIGATALMFANARPRVDINVAGIDLTTLVPGGSFTVPGISTGAFVRAESGDGTVWFVRVRPDAVHVERTDGTGRVQTTVDLPKVGRPSEYCVSRDSRLGLVYGGGATQVYSATGSLMEDVGANGPRGIQCVFLDNGELVGVSGEQLVQYKAGSVASIKPSRLERSDAPVIALALSANRVGIIDIAGGRLSTRDVLSEAFENIQLEAPDLQGVGRSPEVEAIFSAVVDPASHDVFVAVGPYNARSGAVILRFSDGGLLKARFRCVLPVLAPLASDRIHSGQFVFQQIGIAGNTLLLISRSQQRCVYYNLP